MELRWVGDDNFAELVILDAGNMVIYIHTMYLTKKESLSDRIFRHAHAFIGCLVTR
jgi:hypothetical protein